MDIETLAIAKKYANQVGAGGYSSVSVSGTTVTFTLLDGSTASVTVPTPDDGVSVSALGINTDFHLLCTMSDGTIVDAGVIPFVPCDDTLSQTSENALQNKVIKTELDKKVDKVNGKGLSKNDFTDELKLKLTNLDLSVKEDNVATKISQFFAANPTCGGTYLSEIIGESATTYSEYINALFGVFNNANGSLLDVPFDINVVVDIAVFDNSDKKIVIVDRKNSRIATIDYSSTVTISSKYFKDMVINSELSKIPDCPGAQNGDFILKASVVDGVVTYNWVSTQSLIVVS